MKWLGVSFLGSVVRREEMKRTGSCRGNILGYKPGRIPEMCKNNNEMGNL